MQITVMPVTVKILDAVNMCGLSRTTLYRLAGDQKIIFKKAAGRTLVDVSSLMAYLEATPKAEISSSLKKHS